MAGIIPRTSLLDPSVRLSPHSAPDILGFPLAHVDVIMATLMYSQKVFGLPVLVIAVYVV